MLWEDKRGQWQPCRAIPKFIVRVAIDSLPDICTVRSQTLVRVVPKDLGFCPSPALHVSLIVSSFATCARSSFLLKKGGMQKLPECCGFLVWSVALGRRASGSNSRRFKVRRPANANAQIEYSSSYLSFPHLWQMLQTKHIQWVL